ncbi:hypothetical protein Avbf_17631 [Armadillidium vulgare]|nr:hypothetical protein Avbf_17631 [Armadillidium vulgare]
MQQTLECCGVNKYQDWNSYEEWRKDHSSNVAPWSCCEGYDESDEVCSFRRIGKIYQTGCLDAIIDEYQNLTLALGITGVILAIFLFFSMTTACGLARKRKHDH